MKKHKTFPAKTSSRRRRVLARVVAEELKTARGSHHDGTMHTFTQCDPNVCDFDVD